MTSPYRMHPMPLSNLAQLLTAESGQQASATLGRKLEDQLLTGTGSRLHMLESALSAGLWCYRHRRTDEL